MELASTSGHLSDKPDPEHPEPSIRLLILILGFCSFASTVSMRLIDPLVPLIASEFTLGLTQVAMLSPFFTIAYAFGQPFIGPVADSLGKVRIIAFSLALVAILQVASIFATDFKTLAIFRTLTGIASGGVIPVAMAAIADRVPMAERQVALSRLLIATVLGQVSGSLLSGTIGDVSGWRVTFLVAGLIAAFCSLLAFILLKPRPSSMRPSLDLASVIGRYREVLANPQSWRVCLLVMIEGMAVFAVFPFAAELLQNRGAQGATEAGLALSTFGLGGLLYALIAGPLIKHLGPSRMAVVGGIVLACVMIGHSMAFPRWTAPVFFGAQGFGFFLIHSNYQTQATELSTTARSSAMALFASCFFIGTATGPISLAALRQLMPLESTLLVYAAILLVLGLVSGPVLRLSRPANV
jgi:MFS transporter, YNFM family, putative membrane transport protein